MTEEEIRAVEVAGPTIVSIEIAGFETQTVLKEWAKQHVWHSCRELFRTICGLMATPRTAMVV